MYGHIVCGHNLRSHEVARAVLARTRAFASDPLRDLWNPTVEELLKLLVRILCTHLEHRGGVVCGGNKSGGNFLIPVIVVFTGGTTSFEHDASGEVEARGSQSVGSHSRLHGAEVALPLWKVSSQ